MQKWRDGDVISDEVRNQTTSGVAAKMPVLPFIWSVGSAFGLWPAGVVRKKNTAAMQQKVETELTLEEMQPNVTLQWPITEAGDQTSWPGISHQRRTYIQRPVKFLSFMLLGDANIMLYQQGRRNTLQTCCGWRKFLWKSCCAQAKSQKPGTIQAEFTDDDTLPVVSSHNPAPITPISYLALMRPYRQWWTCGPLNFPLSV